MDKRSGSSQRGGQGVYSVGGPWNKVQPKGKDIAYLHALLPRRLLIEIHLWCWCRSSTSPFRYFFPHFLPTVIFIKTTSYRVWDFFFFIWASGMFSGILIEGSFLLRLLVVNWMIGFVSAPVCIALFFVPFRFLSELHLILGFSKIHCDAKAIFWRVCRFDVIQDDLGFFGMLHNSPSSWRCIRRFLMESQRLISIFFSDSIPFGLEPPPGFFEESQTPNIFSGFLDPGSW